VDLAERTRLGRRMDFDTEILVRLYWAEVPIDFLPVEVIYPAGNVSNFRMWWDNLAISWMHTRLFFGMLARLPRILRRRPPLLLGPEPEHHWADQAERGSYWGLRILAAVYRLLGRRACLALMVPVVLYFFATGREQRRASERYLARLHAAGHLPQSPGLALQFRHFMSFAAASLDKLAAWSGSEICAPIASSPAMCRLTGRAPIAQPPGSETRASPCRATSGPSTRIDARMVLTRSYGATGADRPRASTSTRIRSPTVTPTPMLPSSPIMVVTSCRWGTLPIVTGASARSPAARIGSAAFFAPDARISPSRRAPPVICSLSRIASFQPALRADHSAGVGVSSDSAWISPPTAEPSAR
jgi:hypothetical protein